MSQELELTHVHDPSLRNEMFGELKYGKLSNGNRHVELVIMPGEAAGDKFDLNALAIDGSLSMREPFGLHLPPILRKGKNQVEPLGRAIGQFLAKNDRGQSAFAYWACGDDGSDVEPVGLFSSQEFETLSVAGPKNMGGATQLAPIVRYFWEQVFVDAKKICVAVILTDGMWKDQAELLKLTQHMCEEVAAGRRPLMKIVMLVYETAANKGDLAGIEKAMTELNDYDAGTDPEVDVWDHKWVNHISNFAQIYLELEKETSLGVGGKVLDDAGNVVLAQDEFQFGIQFELPADSKGFTLVLDGAGEYKQALP